jgi:transposase
MFRYAKLSPQKINRLLKAFCEDLPAVTAAALAGANRNTADRFYGIFRKAAFLEGARDSGVPFEGPVEVDESYFGPKRVRGKRGRGAGKKTPVFGLLKRGGKVSVHIVPNCSRKALLPILKGKVLEGSEVFSDGLGSYDGLVTMGYRHHRVHHSKNEFARGKNHVNGIESFWSFCKRRLVKFNGVRPGRFPEFLKECEFRFNRRDDPDFFATMKKILKKT